MSIFDEIINKCDPSGLTDEMKAMYIYNKYKSSNKIILFVTNSLYEANKFYQLLSNYTNDLLLFPMDDFLTSEALAISPELKVNRLETILNILESSKKIVITNLMGFLRYLPDKSIFKKKQISKKVSDLCSVDELLKRLIDIGYNREIIVNKTGDFAKRGFVIDVFPINHDNPIRIEFWGDEIESIKVFDINSQQSIKKVDEINIFPASEFLINKGLDSFPKQRELINYIEVRSIYNFTDGICIFNDYEQIKNSYLQLTEEMYQYSIDSSLKADTKYMMSLDEIEIEELIDLKTFGAVQERRELDAFSGDVESINMKFNMYIKNKKIIILCVSNIKRANDIIDRFNNDLMIISNDSNIIDNRINIVIKKISKGFIYNNYIVICENDLFSTENQKVYKSKFKIGAKIKDFNKLNVGDYIVHTKYGIGQYCGLKTLEKNGLKKDYLLIEYKDTDKLYIPVERIDSISKYSSKEGYAPKLSKLGSTDWEKAKFKAKKRIEDMALQLLKLYALRESIKGFAFQRDDSIQMAFEKEFVYKETDDQIKVIDEIKKDMERPHPMDRLLCGDVGYGKTEVAFRAIFKAILSGKQTAILCPTTILSNQHYLSAQDRFKSFSINVAILNRFVTPSKAKQVLENLKSGKIDLLIGTHRILSEDVKFKDLGLLVIDEEQRFGVKHKEKIKTYKNVVDVLTLSATPIPRTLQMSMVGIRSMSLIETPPTDRYPVQTYVLSENKNIIKDAIYKELSRSGQCFILFNNIEGLSSKLEEIKKIAPDAKIEIAHGKLSKIELENIMYRFNNREFDILLCTTIIETGIDIPNVNTLIILDADKFGLSQLYQIRGRVGRSNKIAYCYLMYNKAKVLSEIALKRLKAIKEFTELGSGFAIAMRDLAIRGAGDILGSEQAGFIDTIGIELFMEMLDKEIKKLKGIEVIEDINDNSQPLIEIQTAIDPKYLPDEELRIEMHKNINEIDSYSKLNEVKKKLEDRFGKLDDNMIIYMHEEWFEKKARALNIDRIKQTKNTIEITIEEKYLQNINVQNLFYDVTTLSRMFRFSMRGKNMLISLDIIKLDKHFIYYLIDFLDIIEKNKSN